jgi:SAM-dependent methyltransferase
LIILFANVHRVGAAPIKFANSGAVRCYGMSITLRVGTNLRPLISGSVSLADSDADIFLSLYGLADAEPQGRWTDGPRASMTFILPEHVDKDVILKIEVSAFTWGDVLPEQVVNVSINGRDTAIWKILNNYPRTRAVFVEREIITKHKTVTVAFDLPNCTTPAALQINGDQRRLGIMLRRISWQAVDARPEPEALIWQLGRSVAAEARKSFDQKVESGFWDRFMTGPSILDIGFRGAVGMGDVVPITNTAVGVDLDYPGYDGANLPFRSESQDAVFSSHCLEHIPGYIKAIQEWYRVTKFGGHIITVVPHAHLYERARRPPSKWNADHQRFYTPASLLAEFEAALPPNSYRVRYLEDNDSGYPYAGDPEVHPDGCYEIVLVIEKIRPPRWTVRD